MRWHSLTPCMTSNVMGSTSPTGPTPPSTVCIKPEERWTMKPMDTSRSMTLWMCASSAPSCMTTSMIGLSYQYSVWMSHDHGERCTGGSCAKDESDSTQECV